MFYQLQATRSSKIKLVGQYAPAMKWWQHYSIASFCQGLVAEASMFFWQFLGCIYCWCLKHNEELEKNFSKMSAIDWRSTNLNQIVVISSFHSYIPAGFYREHQTGDYYTYLDHPLPQSITSVMWYLTGSVSACNHDSLTCHNGRALISCS